MEFGKVVLLTTMMFKCGIFCSESSEKCVSSPCQNGATCVDTMDDYVCLCAWDGVRYMGKDCEELYDACVFVDCEGCTSELGTDQFTCPAEVDECASGPCIGVRSECIKEPDGFSCLCPDGFGGEDCVARITDCVDEPCLNNATCRRQLDGFRCECVPGFRGERCEEDIDECVSQPCQNGAICKDGTNEYHCFCVPGYQGYNCEIDINECASRPCENNGTCINGKDRYICECLLGYTGTNCEVEVDECESDPCENGATCNDLMGLYTCDCVKGFSGLNCEINIDECESAPCQNGGTCHDLVDSFECDCGDSGFMGDVCEEDIPECASDPCQHGATCVEGTNGYTCTCWPGFKGLNCEVDVDDCADSPCENGGECFEKSDPTNWDTEWTFSYATAAGYVCQCQPGYTGENCSVNINECVSEPCQNGGTCEDLVNGYVCLCADGFTGVECEVDIDECENAPCLNGGVCEDLVADYLCHCQEPTEGLPAWGGRQCAVELLGCLDHQCQNGATCTPWLDGEEHRHTCLCAPGFSDDFCSTPTTFSFSQPGYFLLEVPVDERKKRSVETERPLQVCLRFRTTLSNRLLFFRGSTDHFLILELVEGALRAWAESREDGVSLQITSSGLVNDGSWHKVCVSVAVAPVEQAEIVLEIKGGGCGKEGCRAQHNTDHAPFLQHHQLTQVYVGGAPEEYLSLTKSGRGFVGCMEDLLVDGRTILPQGAEGPELELGCSKREWCQEEPHPCSYHGDCIDLWTSYKCSCHRPYYGQDCSQEFSSWTYGHESSASFSSFNLLAGHGENFSISFFLRSLKPDGVLLQLQEAESGGTEEAEPYLTVYLQMGRVQVNAVGQSVRSPVFVCDGHKQELQVELQQGDVFFSHAGFNYHLGSVTPVTPQEGDMVYVGGLPDEGMASEWGGQFKGCLQDVRLDNVHLDVGAWNNTANDTAYVPSDAENVLHGCISDDTCKAEPCMNGGECSITWNDFTCSCPLNFTGKTCETRVWCVSDPCVNGGLCVDLLDGFECVANATFDNSPLHYTAKGSLVAPVTNITIDLRTRQENSVLLRAWRGAEFLLIGLLDGTVRAELHGENSLEPVAFSGTQRITDGRWHHLVVAMEHPEQEASSWVIMVDGISDGSSAPEQAEALRFLSDVTSEVALAESYGGCLGVVRVGGVYLPFTDDVAPPQVLRFRRRRGERARLGCVGAPVCRPQPCQHGGTCEDLFHLFRCACPPGWEGLTCETNTDECASGPCLHGSCRDKLGGFECECEPGYGGPTCAQDLDECKDSPCLNRATCMDGVNQYTCICRRGYSGKHCQWNHPPQKCENLECENGGVCRDALWGAECICTPGFTGHRCETEIDECLSSPCLNGGTCLDRLSFFQCVCAAGFSGPYCETNKEAQRDRMPWLVVAIPLACGCALLAVIGLIFILMTARRKRQSEGAYSPSQQEVAGARLEMDSMLKVPPEERLI
ncbi:protein crumbs homolog 2a [Colossoma macropomum]|uniref:protein crumbs homolog 2a n=1 Tax=Colossoma macropomum TaxID=42526 RepID=UPI001863D8EE|nr:protein crumbs homolog 2a [Colossoma macropomum]